MGGSRLRGREERSQDLTFIAVEPEMDMLPGDPRLRDLMRRMQLPT